MPRSSKSSRMDQHGKVRDDVDGRLVATGRWVVEWRG